MNAALMRYFLMVGNAEAEISYAEVMSLLKECDRTIEHFLSHYANSTTPIPIPYYISTQGIKPVAIIRKLEVANG